MLVSILVLVDVALERMLSSYSPRGIITVSILVLVDVALEHPKVLILPSLNRTFQSLFSWMSLLNVHMSEICWTLSPVSILVLVDVALEPPFRAGRRTNHKVSILVLVDVALEPAPIGGTSQVMTGFNPCSRGCRS